MKQYLFALVKNGNKHKTEETGNKTAGTVQNDIPKRNPVEHIIKFAEKNCAVKKNQIKNIEKRGNLKAQLFGQEIRKMQNDKAEHTLQHRQQIHRVKGTRHHLNQIV